jgi:hypothetical protein
MTAAAGRRADIGTGFRSQLPDGGPSETQEWFGVPGRALDRAADARELIARHELDSSVRDNAIEAYQIDVVGGPTAGNHDGSAR